MAQFNQLSDLDRRFFDGNGAALRSIGAALDTAQEIRIATAYFEGSGYQALQDALLGKRVRLLVGRQEGGEDNIRQVLEEFRHELSYGPQENRTRTMRQMLDALEQGWLMVSVGAALSDRMPWLDARYLYHHAKLYIADQQRAVVTSANFSYHGLCRSREAGVVITDPEDVAYFVHRFDEYFGQAQSVTAALIDALRLWLAEYDPYTIYARALLELYGLPDQEAPPQLLALAKYQEGVTSSVLSSLLTHEAAFLIASTGLGKTVIAGHVAAYLRMQGEIDNAIVICPAGLREVWRRTLRAARVASVEFSYHTLQHKDRKQDSNIAVLEHELRQVSESTLIIIDESHWLRNEEANGGDLRLSNRRIRQAVRKQGARILLLTATPYGKDLSEVTNQLNLLPAPKNPVYTALGLATRVHNWRVEKLADISNLPPCTVLTTPDVVRHFGQIGHDGERYVLFGEDEHRFFPRRIRLQTVRFDNPLDDFLADLLTSKLLYKRAETPESVQVPLPLGPLDAPGERLPLQEALFLHQFCSSLAMADAVCEKLEKGQYKYSFARQRDLTTFIQRYRKELRRYLKPRRNPKLLALADLVRAARDDKIVVFCEYHETARALVQGLKSLLPRLSVETTVDCTDLDNLLRRFAPIANEVLPEERNPRMEVQVLVATRAMSEGFNLQDAAILVNYDLPWTVLQLAQRMGRILRPWREPRDVIIYNFVPSTMGHEGVRHARNWERRLQDRSRQHRSLAQIPVLVHQESQNQPQEYIMETLGREMYLAQEESADMDLDQVMEFIQSVDDLTTSRFYNDMAVISNRDELRNLPLGIRSAMVRPGPKRLFLLLRRGRSHVYTVLADARGRHLDESLRREAVMNLIRCEPNTERAPFDVYPDPDDFDIWIERSRQDWAQYNGIDDPSRLQIVCALALVPGKRHV